MADSTVNNLSQKGVAEDTDALYLVDNSSAATDRRVLAAGLNIWLTQTDLESTVGITPTDARYQPGDIRRYGAGTAQSAATNNTAIANALLCNYAVLVFRDGDGSVYEISQSFTLGLYGQRLIFESNGNLSATDTSDVGPRFKVVTGFPTTGGDAAQAVINFTQRNQQLINTSIACNDIALHGVYATGGNITRCLMKQCLIRDTTGDAVLFEDSTFLNNFESVIVADAGGWGFNFDASSGSAGHTTIGLRGCYVNSATSGGYRFDAVVGFTMDACACDSTPAYAVAMTTGGCGVVNGMDCEGTEQLFDLSDTVSRSRLTVSGSRFLNYGNASVNPADIINNAGSLIVQTCLFQTDLGSTAFLVTSSASETYWKGNRQTPLGSNVEFEDLTNTINASSYVDADNVIHLTNTSGTLERFRVESNSTPRIQIHEIGQSKSVQLVVDAGFLRIQTIDASTKAVEANVLTVDLTNRDIVLSPGSGNDLTLGGATSNIALFGGTPGAKPTITGSRGGNAALADLLTKGAALSIWTDSTTA